MAWEISPWRPFEFEKMRKEMDRLWDSFLEGRLGRGIREGEEWIPSLDFSETKSDLVVKAEIPGIDPKDIDISLKEIFGISVPVPCPKKIRLPSQCQETSLTLPLEETIDKLLVICHDI